MKKGNTKEGKKTNTKGTTPTFQPKSKCMTEAIWKKHMKDLEKDLSDNDDDYFLPPRTYTEYLRECNFNHS